MSRSGYALITGASSGIGAAFARALAARGKNLILVARSRQMLEQIARELEREHSISALPYPADLSIPGAAAKVDASLRERNLEVGLLVNNAGFGGRGEFHKLPLERQLEMIRLNVLAVVDLTHLLLPGMVARREGGIINVSSVTGFQSIPYAAVYSATKAFLTSFSMGLAEELRPHGIPVVTLTPGGTKTNFQEIGEKSRAKFPGKPQTPEEVVRQALKKLERGGGLLVPRLDNRALLFAQRFMSRRTVARLVASGSKPKAK
jgi:uncharacterized protein